MTEIADINEQNGGGRTLAQTEADAAPLPPVRRLPGQTSARLSKAHIVIIAVFALLVGLAGTFSVPPLDRDEARFIQASTQMMETGDYLNIRYQETERNKKPAGIYWFQSASVSLFSDVTKREIWAYRLPSMLGAFLAALLTYWAGCRLFGRDVAFIGTLFLVTSASFGGEATIAKTDAMLLATVCAAQAALARLFWFSHVAGGIGLATPREERWLPILFWVAIGLGILIKGPITPMIAFLTLMALCLWAFVRGSEEEGGTKETALESLAWMKGIKPLWGVGIITVMVVPWAIAIGIATDGRFFVDSVGKDMLGKVSEQQERHGGPLGYHLMLVWLFFWSAALYIPLAVRMVFSRWRSWSVAFCLAWAIPSWLVFEITSTKLPHYVLPLYPAIGLLCAFALQQPAEGKEERHVLSKFIGTALYGLATLGLAFLLVQLPMEYGGTINPLFSWIFAAILILGAVAVIFLYWKEHMRFAALGSISLGALFIVFALEGTLPYLNDFRVSPRLSAALDELDLHPRIDGADDVALLGYNEPSAVFLLGTQTKLSTADRAALYISEKPGRVAVVEERFDKDFKDFLRDTPTDKLATFSGFNYSNNKKVTLTIYRSRAEE